MSLTFKLEIQSVKLFILQKLTYIKLSQPTRFCRSRRRVQTPPLEERAEFLIRVVVHVHALPSLQDGHELLSLRPLKRKLLSLSHGLELGQLADLAVDWLFILVYPIRSQLIC